MHVNRTAGAVALAARGMSNDQIADRMVISPMTAKTHINRAMAKLRARDRAQLVVFAYESGLVARRSGSQPAVVADFAVDVRRCPDRITATVPAALTPPARYPRPPAGRARNRTEETTTTTKSMASSPVP